MAHETLMSYYTTNFNSLFYKDIGFVNNFSLEDYETMLPYERDIYIMLMKNKVEEHSKK